MANVFAADFVSLGAVDVLAFVSLLATVFFADCFVAAFGVGVFVAFGVAFFAAGALATVVFFAGVLALSVDFFATVFFVAVVVFVVLALSAAAAPPALAFQPKRFNLPTIAFLDMPNRLPISDVDNPLPVRAFNFFKVALSQPLLIL